MTRPRRTTSAPAPREADQPMMQPPVASSGPANKASAAAGPARPRRKPAARKIAEQAPAAPVPVAKPRRKPATRKIAAQGPDAPSPIAPVTNKPRRKPRATRSVAAEPWRADEFIFGADHDLPDNPGIESPAGTRDPGRSFATPTPQLQVGASDQGEAAQERARIRAGMQQIRQLIDGPDDRSSAGAMLMLQRLCHDPLPRRRLAGSTAQVSAFPPPAVPSRQSVARRKPPALMRSAMEAVAQVAPAARPLPQDQQSDPGDTWISVTGMPATPLPPQPVLTSFSVFYAAPSDALPTAVPSAVTHPRSRIRRLLTAWADWLMWQLQPPRIPQAALPAAGSAPVQMPAEAAHTLQARDEDRSPARRSEMAEVGGDDRRNATPERLPARDEGPASAAPPAEPDAAPSAAPVDPPEIVLTGDSLAQALSRAIDGGTLRDHLQAMIRDELAGEMGARFSGNLQAVIRREVANGLDDRLTHL